MRIALVGLGGMGTTHYLNYLHIADAQVVAAVGKSEQDRARAAQWGLPLYDTLTELCAAQQVDLAAWTACDHRKAHRAVPDRCAGDV